MKAKTTKAPAKKPAAPKTAVKAKAPAKKATPKKAATEAKSAPVGGTLKKRRVTFTYRADKGLTVYLAGCFNKWSPSAKKMIDTKKNGIYTATVTLPPGSYEYKYVIDGTWCADPECADWVQNDHGTLNSVKHVSV